MLTRLSQSDNPPPNFGHSSLKPGDLRNLGNPGGVIPSSHWGFRLNFLVCSVRWKTIHVLLPLSSRRGLSMVDGSQGVYGASERLGYRKSSVILSFLRNVAHGARQITATSHVHSV